MQTKFLAAAVTSGWDRNLLSIVSLPGHHMPGTPAQWGAPLTNRIGLPVRRASAKPRVKVAYHWIGASAFGVRAGNASVLRSGTVPPPMRATGGGGGPPRPLPGPPGPPCRPPPGPPGPPGLPRLVFASSVFCWSGVRTSLTAAPSAILRICSSVSFSCANAVGTKFSLLSASIVFTSLSSFSFWADVSPR